MSTAIGSLTAESAPRDPMVLATIGRYQLRRLAADIGLSDTDEKKAAFASSTPDEMAQAVSVALKLLDASRGKSPQSELVQPKPEEELVQQATDPAYTVIPVTEAAPLREPVTRGRPPKAKEVTEMPQTEELGKLRMEIARLSDVLTGLQQHIKSDNYANSLYSLAREMHDISVQQEMLLSLLLLVAEEVKVDTRDNLLKKAFTQRAAATDMFNSLRDLEGTEPEGKG